MVLNTLVLVTTSVSSYKRCVPSSASTFLAFLFIRQKKSILKNWREPAKPSVLKTSLCWRTNRNSFDCYRVPSKISFKKLILSTITWHAVPVYVTIKTVTLQLVPV